MKPLLPLFIRTAIEAQLLKVDLSGHAHVLQDIETFNSERKIVEASGTYYGDDNYLKIVQVIKLFIKENSNEYAEEVLHYGVYEFFNRFDLTAMIIKEMNDYLLDVVQKAQEKYSSILCAMINEKIPVQD